MTTEERLIEMARTAREEQRTADYGSLLAALDALGRPIDSAVGVSSVALRASGGVLMHHCRLAVDSERFVLAAALEDTIRLLQGILAARGESTELIDPEQVEP